LPERAFPRATWSPGQGAASDGDSCAVGGVLASGVPDDLGQEVSMESRAKLFGHPIHQMLVVFPLGLLSAAAVFDVLYLVTGQDRWPAASFLMIGAGVIGGLVAAVFGLVDWLGIPAGTRAKRIGLWHGVGNAVVVTLFGASWLVRADSETATPGLAIALSLAGLALGGVTGWLGGELVDRLGVGVDQGAHLDAPSSLRERGVPRQKVDDRTALRPAGPIRRGD
jgi:uncharacterized membrane protein